MGKVKPKSRKYLYDARELVREYPVLKGLSKPQKEELEIITKKLVSDYLPKVRTNFDTVDYVEQAAIKAEFDGEKNYFIKHEDGEAFALVRLPKKRTDDNSSLRIISTHNDIPNLMITGRPILFEADHELKDLHVGVRLTVRDNGNIESHQWYGQNVLIKGWTVKNGKRRTISIPAFIPEVSAHVSDRGGEDFKNAFPFSRLQVTTFDSSPADLLKKFGFMDEDIDFARSRLFVVPSVAPERGENYFVTGYGMDDSLCNFAALQALLSIKNPKNPCILVGFNHEETSRTGGGSADSQFLRRVLYKVISDYTGLTKNSIVEPIFDEFLEKSFAIGADVTIAPTHMEQLETPDLVDRWNVARLCYGIGVDTYMAEGGNHISPRMVDWVFTNVLKKAGLMKTRFPHYQTIGPIPHPDNPQDMGTQSFYLARMGLEHILDMSIPLSSVHGVTSTCNVGDIYSAKRAYQAFFES